MESTPTVGSTHPPDPLGIGDLFQGVKQQRHGLDGSVGIATRYGLDGPRIESRCGVRFSAPVQTDPGAHPAPYTVGTGSFPGVQRPGRGVEHPPPSSAEVKERVGLYHYSPFGPP